MTMPRAVSMLLFVGAFLFLGHPDDCAFSSLRVTIGAAAVSVTVPGAVSKILSVSVQTV